MFETETFGPFLFQKLKWEGHGPPGLPSCCALVNRSSVQQSQMVNLFLFALIWKCVQCFIIQNLMNTFTILISHSFNFVNMTFIVKFRRIYFHGMFITELCFLFSHIFPWINKFLFTENNFLPRSIKQGSYSSPHCIFQSVYSLNTRSIKIHRRSVVKVYVIN